MGDILMFILYLIVAVAIVIGLSILGKKYVFTKVKINKWIVLAIAAVLFILQVLFTKQNTVLQYASMIPIIWFFLWFMELQSGAVVKGKEKKIVIKSKAKPNRAKHLHKDNK